MCVYSGILIPTVFVHYALSLDVFVEGMCTVMDIPTISFFVFS
jgi:hypothetical protein